MANDPIAFWTAVSPKGAGSQYEQDPQTSRFARRPGSDPCMGPGLGDLAEQEFLAVQDRRVCGVLIGSVTAGALLEVNRPKTS